jgi:hypothetical protein
MQPKTTLTIASVIGLIFSFAMFLAPEFVTREQFPNSEGQGFADLVTLRLCDRKHNSSLGHNKLPFARHYRPCISDTCNERIYSSVQCGVHYQPCAPAHW